MNNRFELNLDQCDKMDKWMKEHNKTCPFKTGEMPQAAIGGRISYRFTPTGLGMTTEVCCACGEIVNLTEHDKW